MGPAAKSAPFLRRQTMRLKHIEVFNAIMLTGSASAAARLLHVSSRR
jgi:hypothetical protein